MSIEAVPVAGAGVVGARTEAPTAQEISDPRIHAWWFVTDYAIRNGLDPEIVIVRGIKTPQAYKHGCVDPFRLESLKGYWLPIHAPSEWCYPLARERLPK